MKICANFFLLPTIELKENAGSGANGASAQDRGVATGDSGAGVIGRCC